MSSPRIRVVVVDYDGGDRTVDCLEHLVATQHPADALDIVLVDNGSDAPVTTRVRRDLPTVRMIASPVNLGFAGGCNLGLGNLEDVDFVALVNNDATVPPTWLKPLIETLATEATVGAACPKILLARAYRELTIHSATVRPGHGDAATSACGSPGSGSMGPTRSATSASRPGRGARSSTRTAVSSDGPPPRPSCCCRR